MKQITILWFIFVIMFLSLAIFHFYNSTKRIEKINISSRPGAKSMTVKIMGSDIDQTTKDLGDNFNQHIEEINNSNKWNHIITGIGYLLASFTAFFSFYLSITKKYLLLE